MYRKNLVFMRVAGLLLHMYTCTHEKYKYYIEKILFLYGIKMFSRVERKSMCTMCTCVTVVRKPA